MSHFTYTKGALTTADDVRELALFLEAELARIEAALMFFVANPFPVQHAPPTKLPQDEILFAFADGTDWDPGGGRGLYYHDPAGGGSWKKVTVT